MANPSVLFIPISESLIEFILLQAKRASKRYDPEQKQPYTYFPMDSEVGLYEYDNIDSSLDNFALNILARVVALEERVMGRMSGLRVFCRLDVSVYQEKNGDHKYFVNEITRTHGAALFPQWDSKKRLDSLFTNLSDTLHYISSNKLYLRSPPSF